MYLCILCIFVSAVYSQYPILWSQNSTPKEYFLHKNGSATTSLILNNGVTLKQNVEYHKRQLFQSTQVVNIAHLNVLARNIKMQLVYFLFMQYCDT